MLRDIIYEILMNATGFVKVITIAEDFFDMEKNIFVRFIVKASNVIGWILLQLLLISMTGGLYLIWIALKMIWKICRPKRKDRKPRRKRA